MHVLTYGYMNNSMTGLSGIKKVGPGEIRVYNIDGKYLYSENIKDERTERKEKPSAKTIKNLMEETVKENMLSDVSCGVLLSGGLDSSIVAYEAIRADKNINLYTCRR